MLSLLVVSSILGTALFSEEPLVAMEVPANLSQHFEIRL